MKNFTIWVLFVMALYSCSKELGNSEDNRIVEDAKQYHLSQNQPLKFLTAIQSDTKGEDEFYPQWDRCIIYERDNFTYVEIPLKNSLYETSTDGNGNDYVVSSRLVVRHDTNKDERCQFMVSRILKKKCTDIDHKRFSDLSIESYMFIYNLDGEIRAKYEVSNGRIRPINERLYGDIKNELKFQINYSPLSMGHNVTHSDVKGILTYPSTCVYCSNIAYNYTCTHCGLVDTFYINYNFFFSTILKEIIDIITECVQELYPYEDFYYQYEKASNQIIMSIYNHQSSYNNRGYIEQLHYITEGFLYDHVDSAEFLFISSRELIWATSQTAYYTSPYAIISNALAKYRYQIKYDLCSRMAMIRFSEINSNNTQNPNPYQCTDTKCSNCGKCINPTRPDCDKCICCGHTLRCQSEGCGKLIRTNINTRATMNCSHSEDDFCPSSEAVCECGERHCNEETGLPKCTEASYWLILNSLDAGINHIKEYIKRTKIELAGISMTSGKTYIQYDPRNTSGESRFVLGQCKKLDGRIYFIDEGTLKKDYIEIFFHGHPEIENKIKTIEGKEGMYAHELSISPEDYLMLTKYGCLGLIVTEFGAFRFTSSAVESIFCPLYIPNN